MVWQVLHHPPPNKALQQARLPQTAIAAGSGKVGCPVSGAVVFPGRSAVRGEDVSQKKATKKKAAATSVKSKDGAL